MSDLYDRQAVEDACTDLFLLTEFNAKFVDGNLELERG
jgi:hypothetical protein